jgi:hypothetical protein
LRKELATSVRPDFHANSFQGVKMDSVTKMSADVIATSTGNVMLTAMAIACGLALVVFVCVATPGLDLSAGFF